MFPSVPRKPAQPKLSSDRARTLRNKKIMAAGYHPATGRLLLDGEVGRYTCADCVHCKRVARGWRDHWKCDTKRITRGAATDIRKSWPACVLFEELPQVDG
jgi:hypothetical protein